MTQLPPQPQWPSASGFGPKMFSPSFRISPAAQAMSKGRTLSGPWMRVFVISARTAGDSTGLPSSRP